MFFKNIAIKVVSLFLEFLSDALKCKEMQPVYPKGDQSRVFIGRNDAKAETPILWPPHAKSWLIVWCWEGLGAEEGDDRGWDGWMASLTRRTWVWVNSRSWWWTGRPGVLRFMGSQRVGHDWVTELNWTEIQRGAEMRGAEMQRVLIWRGCWHVEGAEMRGTEIGRGAEMRKGPEIWRGAEMWRVLRYGGCWDAEYDSTVEVRNRFKGLDLIDKVPNELWTEVRDIVQGIKTIPMEKKCKKAKWLSGEALQIAVKKKRGENQRRKGKI